MQLQVSISESPAFEEVDAEIVVVAGCALGFVSGTCPPHVLHIEADSPLESAGVGQDDILYKVNGSDIGNPFPGKDRVMELMAGKVPLDLAFIKPKDVLHYIPGYKGALGASAEELMSEKEIDMPEVEAMSEKEVETGEPPLKRQKKPVVLKPSTGLRVKGPFDDEEEDLDFDERGTSSSLKASASGLKDRWTIAASRARAPPELVPNNTVASPFETERANVAVIGAAGAWCPPGSSQAATVVTLTANRNSSFYHQAGHNHHQGPGSGVPSSDTIILQNLPPHMQNVLAITPHLSALGYEVKNLRLVSNNTGAVVQFANPDTAVQVINIVTNAGHFAGIREISARPYFLRNNKGGKSGSERGKGGNARNGSSSNNGGSAADKVKGSNVSQTAADTSANAASTGPVENQTLESSKITQQKLIKKEVTDKKNVLLTHATERIQLLLQKLSDPNLSAAKKEKYGVLLHQFKQKLTLLTASTAPPVPPAVPVKGAGGAGGKGMGMKGKKGAASWGETTSWELLVHLKTEVPEDYADKLDAFEVVRQQNVAQWDKATSANWTDATPLTEESRGRAADGSSDETFYPTVSLRFPDEALAKAAHEAVHPTHSVATTLNKKPVKTPAKGGYYDTWGGWNWYGEEGESESYYGVAPAVAKGKGGSVGKKGSVTKGAEDAAPSASQEAIPVGGEE